MVTPTVRERSFGILPLLTAALLPVSASAGSMCAIDHSGNLFVSESSDSKISKFTPAGVRTKFASGIDGSLAFDAASNLFVGASDATGTIFKLAPDGSRTTFAAQTGNPASLAFDPAGDLFVYDLNTGSILKFTPNGEKRVFAEGKKPPGQMFANSMALACDHAGNLFAVESGSDTIFKFAPDGRRTPFATKAKATELAFDSVDNLYAANFSSSTILKFAPNGTRKVLKTGLAAPESMAFDPTGNLFVYDGPDTIYKFAPDGTKVVFAQDPPEPLAAKSQSPAEVEPGADSSAGLPATYAKNYLIAQSTISSNKKFAVIYPTRDHEDFPEGKNYVVSLEPFAIAGSLGLSHPYFQHQSNAAISAQWSDDSVVALVTVDGKWAPSAIVLLEFAAAKVKHATDLVPKIDQILVRKVHERPEFRHLKSLNFNSIEASLDGTRSVKVSADASTASQNDLGLTPHAWVGELEATWDIAQAKFTSQKVSGRIRKPTKED
jgi:sugar lactone lactonase YvrE